ncbi:MAG TPA: hypothetical protein VFB62_27515 [Polyangiaceae bacterium]|nr:hypothetical protein [Polyangiaceae bacterium]
MRGLGIAIAMTLCLVAPCALADPQANSAITIGGAGVGSEGEFWDHAEFHMGLRADVLFGREETRDFGGGPYVEFGTFAFDELSFGGGGSVLFPIHESLPLVASLGAYGRYGDDEFGLEPGITGSIFWGTRSYNFHHNYVLAAGLLVGYRYTFGESRESALVISAQLDLALLGLPFVALIGLMRGPSSEAAPIE